MAIIAAVAFLLSACGTNSNTIEYKQQEGAMQNLLKTQPVLQLPYSVERAQANTLLSIRNLKMFNTYVYIVDVNGNFTKLCNARGFGLPYAVQLTNPLKLAFPDNSESAVVANADPNGLYYPSSANATWILCIVNKGEDGYVLSPQYIEENVNVFTFEVDGTKELKIKTQASVTLNENDLVGAAKNAISTTITITPTVVR